MPENISLKKNLINLAPGEKREFFSARGKRGEEKKGGEDGKKEGEREGREKGEKKREVSPNM